MREILFRGKRIDNGEWVYGYYYESKISGCFILVPKIKVRKKDGIVIGDSFDVFEVIPETVGQFTGLCDNNGNKIFEGNILLKGFEKVLVKWNANQCRWGIYSNNYEICGFNESTQGYFEVVGNIYDNPELLKVKQ